MESDGEFYQGEEAWEHMEQEAGAVVSVFIENYIKPAIQDIEEVEMPVLQSINLSWSEQTIEISSTENSYLINRT